MVAVLYLVVVAAATNGDVNGDGCVDLWDYSLMQIAWSDPGCERTMGGCCLAFDCEILSRMECEWNGGDWNALNNCEQAVCPEPTFEVDMVTVEGGGAGPAYSFEIGRFEVTNEQFAAFLNDASLGSEHGQYVDFRDNGLVTTAAGDMIVFVPRGWYGSSCSRILFNSEVWPGEQYRAMVGFEKHPVTCVGWFGAVKFCNWLTIDQGLSRADVCYTEGEGNLDWHPVSISKTDWRNRDLNDGERQALVDNCRGFRLPMDNLGASYGYFSQQENPFNEWYKAAAFDPEGPPFERMGVHGEVVSAFHWMSGNRWDHAGPRDANSSNSGDPFDNGTTPVGYYDGTGWLNTNLGATFESKTFFGLYDISGNVREWMQDQGEIFEPLTSRALRGGSWNDDSYDVVCSARRIVTLTGASEWTGFRVLRVP